jgi:hypothetical protein
MKRFQLRKIVILMLIVIGAIPSQIFVQGLTPNENTLLNSHLSSLRGTQGRINIPRLLKQNNQVNTSLPESSSQNYISINHEQANFLIGSQNGIGEGVYSVYDSLNITNTENLDTSDTYNSPEVHDDSTTISIPAGYKNNTGIFNISSVTAIPDWRDVEDDRVDNFVINSDVSDEGYVEVAMEISFLEEFVELSQVRIYTRPVQYSNVTGDYDPNGTVFIVNGTDQGSYWAPDETDILSSVEILSLSSGWRTYTFDSPIVLKNTQHYFAIFNDTSTTPAYWEWGAQRDTGASNSDNDNEGEFFYVYLTHGTGFNRGIVATAFDLDLKILVKPMDQSGVSFIDKVYFSPYVLNFTYVTTLDTTQISQFDWFEWNGTSDNVHKFETNTSVTFDLQWITNITYSNNPLVASSAYQSNNNSEVIWSLNFTTSDIITSYTIKNRTISILGLENDWDGNSMYHGTTLVYNQTNDGLFNSSVIYNNKSSTMIINSSTLISTTDWNVTFDAPNYLYTFNKISMIFQPLLPMYGT